MRGSSAESYARLEEALPASPDGSGDQLGDELIATARLLRSQAALRRAVTDTASETLVRTQLLSSVFGPHLSADAARVVALGGEVRWARSTDFPEALERLGVVAIVRAADTSGQGEQIEDELFVFGRTVAGSPELREALSDPARSVADKQRLIGSLLDGKAAPATARLARESVAGGWRTITIAIDELIEIAASARRRQVATVRTAHPISGAQRDRLRASLARQVGTDVHLNVIVDPSLVGGLLVEIGDDVIDGTVGARLDDVRRRIAG